MKIGKEKEKVKEPGKVRTLPKRKPEEAPIPVPNWPQPEKVPVKTGG